MSGEGAGRTRRAVKPTPVSNRAGTPIPSFTKKLRTRCTCRVPARLCLVVVSVQHRRQESNLHQTRLGNECISVLPRR